MKQLLELKLAAMATGSGNRELTNSARENFFQLVVE